MKGTARRLTVGLAICALLIMGLTYWQVLEQGGLSSVAGRKRLPERSVDDEDGHSLVKGSKM